MENEDHIDDSLATAVEEKMDTPSTGVANGNHDNAVKESQCEVTGVENETSPEPETRKEEAADTHPTQNGRPSHTVHNNNAATVIISCNIISSGPTFCELL